MIRQSTSYYERPFVFKGSGSHFDPDIVAAFLEDFDAMTAIADQYQDRGNPEG